ncbi:MAG: hypothetical protein ACYCYA_08775 [Actinomycetes bacterium]
MLHRILALTRRRHIDPLYVAAGTCRSPTDQYVRTTTTSQEIDHV